MARLTPRVSVVIPTRNRKRLLLRALGSALGQEGVHVEVIVVDEGSTDGTADAVESLGETRVTVVRNEFPRGVAAARNAGLERAEHDWVAFLDDDDFWAPGKLAAQVDAIAARPGGEWCCAGAVVVNESLTVVGIEACAQGAGLIERLLAYNAIPGGGSSVLARTAAVREVGGFDTELTVVADWDLWIRLALRSPLAAVDRPLVAYVRHASSMSANLEIRAELEHVIEKHERARDEHGVTFPWDRWLGWRALMLRRAGRRWEPARIYAALSRGRRPRLLVRAVLALVWPSWVELRERRALRDVDPNWLAEAEDWLALFRADPAGRATPSGVEAHELEPASARGLDHPG